MPEPLKVVVAEDEPYNRKRLSRLLREAGCEVVAELTDGRSLAVEYKGGHLATNADTQAKEWVGDKWADASEGRCVFLMMKDGDFGALDRVLAR